MSPPARNIKVASIARILSPNGKEVFSGGQGKKLVIWNADTGKTRVTLDHPGVLWGLAVSRDGKQALSGAGGSLAGDDFVSLVIRPSNDNALCVWNVPEGKLIHELQGHTHAVYTADFSPDGKLAVSGGWDGTIRLWDLESGEELSKIEGQGGVMSLSFSPRRQAGRRRRRRFADAARHRRGPRRAGTPVQGQRGSTGRSHQVGQ